MRSKTAGEKGLRTGWSGVLSKTAAAIVLFELMSGLAITFGPFHPAIEWGVLLHTVVGAVTLAPLVWYSVVHWKDYRDQALSDVLLLGYIGLGALALCLLSGLLVMGQALVAPKTSPWLRYTHLASTLLLLATTGPHILIAWWRRRRAEASEGAMEWLAAGLFAIVVGVGVIGVLTFAYRERNITISFPPTTTTLSAQRIGIPQCI
jgi:hypothetical protein